MNKTVKIGGLVLAFFSLVLGVNALAAKVDSAPVSGIKYQPTVKIDALAATNNVNQVTYQSQANSQSATPLAFVSAGDVTPGTFGSNAGGGNYVFPANLTVNGQTTFNNNVGVGLTNPEAKFHVYDSTGSTVLELSSIPNHQEPMIKLKGYNEMDWMWIDSNSIDNVFIGVEAGLHTVGQPVAGRYNIFMGHQAGYSNMFATHNTAIGDKAFYSGGLNYGSNYNVVLGAGAGYSTTGAGNVFLGYKAGYNETGSNKLYIANSDTNTLIYGDFATGRIGFGTTNPNSRLAVKGSLTIQGNSSATTPRGFLGLDSLDRGLFNLSTDTGNKTIEISSTGTSYLNGGAVGIGTSNPEGFLTVKSPDDTTNQLYLEQGGANQGWAFWANFSDLSLSSRVSGVNTNRVTFKGNGNVGIGTANPDATLRVNGSMKANSYYSANGNAGLSRTVRLRGAFNQPCTMTFENGLMTATNCPQ